MFDPNTVLQQCTLAEKAALCSGLNFWQLRGIPRLHVPSIMVCDGPHGLRKQTAAADHIGLSPSYPATCFPPAVTLACTWNPALAYAMGVALGRECRDHDVSVLLGPGVNIKRHPYCGRNFEYFSEDPLLSGDFASEWIKGVQSCGVGTSLKHFALNEQESNRMVVDVIVDERTMHDIYLKPFKHAIIQAQPWTIMSAYNKVNGHTMSEHPTLLDPLVRKQWGFKGAIISDWGANNDRIAALHAGLDIEMPGGFKHQSEAIIKAVETQSLTMDVLDERVLTILQLIKKAVQGQSVPHIPSDLEAHHNLARTIAAEGIVLLKNEQQCLPLAKNSSLAVIGAFAHQPRYQGSGSSVINPHRISTFAQALTSANIPFVYAPGYSLKHDEVDVPLIDAAIAAIQGVDVVICMVGLCDRHESEGFDRKDLHLPQVHVRLIEALCHHHAKVVVCLSNGAPVTMPWNSMPLAIVEAYLGGQASGEALMDVLFGDVNPSGKLAETFASHVNQHCSSYHFPGEPKQVQYREGIYVGYRWFTTAKLKPLYPFGHGLSYSTFMVFGESIALQHRHIEVQGVIHNTSARDGAQTVQVYAHFPHSHAIRPHLTLIGYKKIKVQAHHSEVFKISIPISECGLTHEGQWFLEATPVHVRVGFSSEEILFAAQIEIKGEEDRVNQIDSPYYAPKANFEPSQADFETLLGHPVSKPIPRKPYTFNSTLDDCSHNYIGKLFLKVVVLLSRKMKQGVADEFNHAMLDAMIREMPLRSLIQFSQGKLTYKRVAWLLKLMNKWDSEPAKDMETP